MNVIISKEADGKTIVRLSGRLDTTNVTDFEKEVAPLMQMEKPDIVIECDDFNYISSSGLRIFLTLQKHVAATGGSLTIRKMKAEIREVFDMTGFSAIFTIEE